MAETPQSVITDEMRATIGKPLVTTKWEVTTTGVRMFARAVGYTDLIHYDIEYAKSKGYPSIVAPPVYFGTSEWRPGMAERLVDYLPGIADKRLLNGGNEYEYYETVCAGEVLDGTLKIVSLNERDGAMGHTLFCIFQTDYTNEKGKLVGAVRHTIVAY